MGSERSKEAKSRTRELIGWRAFSEASPRAVDVECFGIAKLDFFGV